MARATEKIVNSLACSVFSRAFLPEPTIFLDQSKRTAFDAYLYHLKTASGSKDIPYAAPYPKYEFLHYAVQYKGLFLHGSNHAEIKALEPRPQTDWNGHQMKAVFATSSAIWPMFFAILNDARYQGGLRNACFVVGDKTSEGIRYYFFSLENAYQHEDIWCTGYVYLLPKETFHPTSEGLVRFDEWASETPVTPLGKITIKPEDFPFLKQVAWHKAGENMLLSWLLYKRRLRKK